MKSARAGKVMKAKRVSKVARGRLTKVQVFRGRKECTAGGLKKDGLIKNKIGKVVSRKRSVAAKRRFSAGLGKWIAAVSAARKALGITGFLAINGKSPQGKALYAKARVLYTA